MCFSQNLEAVHRLLVVKEKSKFMKVKVTRNRTRWQMILDHIWTENNLQKIWRLVEVFLLRWRNMKMLGLSLFQSMLNRYGNINCPSLAGLCFNLFTFDLKRRVTRSLFVYLSQVSPCIGRRRFTLVVPSNQFLQTFDAPMYVTLIFNSWRCEA